MDSAVGRGVVGPWFEPHSRLLFFVLLTFSYLFFSIKKALLTGIDYP